MSYEDIYALKPKYETEPGWWKLAWRPLWRKTFSAYLLKNWVGFGMGARCFRMDANNGWGRSYKHLTVEMLLGRYSLFLWIKWNYIVMAEGPLDATDRRPLAIPR